MGKWFPFDKKCLVNFEKWFKLFKSVNHFSQAVDTFDPFLNDAINLHVQAVDHHRNLADAGIWQHPVTVVGFQPPLSKSGQARFWLPEWSDSNTNGIRPTQILMKLFGFRPLFWNPAGEWQNLIIGFLYYFTLIFFMLWIKIDFYKLIWLNKNIKNICDFL